MYNNMGQKSTPLTPSLCSGFTSSSKLIFKDLGPGRGARVDWDFGHEDSRGDTSEGLSPLLWREESLAGTLLSSSHPYSSGMEQCVIRTLRTRKLIFVLKILFKCQLGTNCFQTWYTPGDRPPKKNWFVPTFCHKRPTLWVYMFPDRKVYVLKTPRLTHCSDTSKAIDVHQNLG